jgi:hypothetical protein
MDVTFIETESFFRKDTIHSQGERLFENETWHQLGLYGNVNTGGVAGNPNPATAATDPNPATAATDPNFIATTDPNLDPASSFIPVQSGSLV